MQFQGGNPRGIRSRLARLGGAAIVASLTVAAVAGPATATDAASDSKGLWAVTRDAHGGMHVVRGLQAQIAATDNRLGRMSTRVLSIEHETEMRQLGTNDTYRSMQWALNRVSFEDSWAFSKGAGITVAVVDTGVMASHEDLAGAVVPGTDLAADASTYDPWGTGAVDPGGHGTHVAGIIAARANNGKGIAGGAPNVRIMPVRVLTAAGSGSSADVAEGIIYAADHGAKVINLSLGGGAQVGMQIAIQYALSKNVLTFAAAGNYYQSGNTPTYPAAYPEAVAVAAVDANLNHAVFSNTGSYVDIAAPGDNIISTYNSGPHQYTSMSGTSMATPYAAAAGALIYAANPKLTASQVLAALQGSAIDRGAPGKDSVFGSGLINPRGALAATAPNKPNAGTQGNGYWVVSARGNVWAYGGARWYGDVATKSISAPIIASARTPTGKGYWLAGMDGAVYSFGDARYYGSLNHKRLTKPIVGMAAMPDGKGYILLGQDGGIFNFGSSRYYGSTGNKRLNSPVLDLAITKDGKGYWFAAGDGGVFTFGNAHFYGSTGNRRLNSPVKSITAASNGTGYWMVADDGGIFAFGTAPYVGSLPQVRKLYNWPYIPSVRMRSLPTRDGYYILGSNGAVTAFGKAKYFGSAPRTWAVDLMQAV
jgi:subtilisin family serine protease